MCFFHKNLTITPEYGAVISFLPSESHQKDERPNTAQSMIFLERKYIISAIFRLLTGKPEASHSRSIPMVPFAV